MFAIGVRLGENNCTMCFVPAVDINLRTRIRTLGGIEGDMCNDCIVVACCAQCAACQEYRELHVRFFFEETLEIPKERIEKMLFQAVHRLPGKESDKEKRKIIVRFNSLIDRDDVLAAGMKLKRGSGYSVVPDVPPSVAKLRFNLLNERRALPSSEQRKVHLVYIKDYPFVMLKKKDVLADLLVKKNQQQLLTELNKKL
ncbi:Hypothetical predicted protein [Mytilus galloprovincialis]|uniref:Uncharacterized protein n=1 Tax=Mytilus galloprovincialis TaxID=29158 RepID=A0A8B6E011_MYTGA|nr:Hypothetical predicted protein [Mytilus galloprovincialis]